MTESNNQLVSYENGHCVDHIAIGVFDTLRGVDWIEELTGCETCIEEPEPGQWYWSASLRIGKLCFLEILGPNPKFHGFHFFREMLKSIKKPEPLFWYISTSDFEAFKELSEKNNAPLERIERIKFEREGKNVDYTRGIIGPGFISQRPNVIQWHSRLKCWRIAQENINMQSGCRLKALKLKSRKSKELATLFSALNIEMEVTNGSSELTVEIDSPKGTIVLTGKGIGRKELNLLTMVRFYLKYLFCEIFNSKDKKK